MARLAICNGVCPAMIGKDATSACPANCCNCSCAAGRWVSRLASSTRRRSRVRSRSASLPDVVVLPEPCSPTIRIGIGEGAFRFSGDTVPPSAATSTSLTIFTTIWPGETERRTSAPTAFSRTSAMKSFTTGSATSASSKARRISRIASFTSVSLKAPRRRSFSKTSPNLPDSASNMLNPTPNAKYAVVRTLAARRNSHRPHLRAARPQVKAIPR